MSHQDIVSGLRKILDATGVSDKERLGAALHLVARYRSTLVSNTIVKNQGTTVVAGPFAGMEFVDRSSEGCHAPKLLGCYEAELHDFIREAVGAGYDTIINVGCAEGYYAVGFKRIIPGAKVLAFDTNGDARTACRALAERNRIAIDVGGTLEPGDFRSLISPGRRALVWCDIEGGEIELLDPVVAPRLREADIVVELHPTRRGHAVDILPGRFRASHEVEIIHAGPHHPALPPLFRHLSHMDQLLAQWEWRTVPTPWAVMRARAWRSGVGGSYSSLFPAERDAAGEGSARGSSSGAP